MVKKEKIPSIFDLLDLLHLSKIGDIPIMVHRQIDGKIKQIIVKRYNSGKWYACISVDKEMSIVQREPKKVIGIDMGIKHFLTDSKGRQVENPKFYQRTLQTIKVIQHWLSRKKKGSKNRGKMKLKLAKVYERLTNQSIREMTSCTSYQHSMQTTMM